MATGRPCLQWEVGQWLGEGEGWSQERGSRSGPPLYPSLEGSVAGLRECPCCNIEDSVFDIYNGIHIAKIYAKGLGSITPSLCYK